MKKCISILLTLRLMISLPGLLTGTTFLILAAISDDSGMVRAATR